MAFWSINDQQIKKIPVAGGAALPLTDLDINPFGISWDQDETMVYGATEGVMGVSASGGDPTLLVPEALAPNYPQFLPSQNAVLFSFQGESGSRQVAVRSLDSDESKELFPGSHPRYLSTGHIVYAQDDVLFAVRFDADRLEVTGERVPLVQGVQEARWRYAVSDTGSLVYATEDLTRNVTLAFVDRSGAVGPLSSLPSGAYSRPRLSPDGDKIAVQREAEEGADIWVYDRLGDAFRRLTRGGGNTNPLWTPDGRRITFSSNRDEQPGIYWRAADGSGVAELLVAQEGQASYVPESWTHDRGTLSFRRPGDQGFGLWTLSLDDGNEPQPFYDIADNQLASQFSPNGNWMAYVSGPRGSSYIEVQPFPATDELYQVTPEPGQGSFPVFSADGTELFYRRNISDTQGTIASVDVSTDGTFTYGDERELPISGFVIGLGYRMFDVTPDGQQFLMLFPADQADSGVATGLGINVILNWVEELN